MSSKRQLSSKQRACVCTSLLCLAGSPVVVESDLATLEGVVAVIAVSHAKLKARVDVATSECIDHAGCNEVAKAKCDTSVMPTVCAPCDANLQCAGMAGGETACNAGTCIGIYLWCCFPAHLARTSLHLFSEAAPAENAHACMLACPSPLYPSCRPPPSL